jgi:hypothetical protein
VYHSLGRKYLIPDPDELHSGDYALLLAYSGLTYDRERQQLVWPDGRTKSVDEIIPPAEGMMLLRTR